MNLCIHRKMSGPRQIHSMYLERAKDQGKEREEWKKKAKKEPEKTSQTEDISHVKG